MDLSSIDLSPGALIAAFFVSSLGLGLFLYGKKQTRFPQLIVGMAMMAYPNFVGGPLAIWSIAGALTIALMAALRSGL